jgi:hypothetical protein
VDAGCNIMKFSIIALILLASISASAAGESSAVLKNAEIMQKSDEQSFGETEQTPGPLQEGMPSVEDLMVKKLDIAQKVDKIEKIESVVSGTIPDPKAIIQDKTAYKPLRDEDAKQIQSAPPFRAPQVVN